MMTDEQIKEAATEITGFVRELVRQWVDFRGHEENIAAIINKHSTSISADELDILREWYNAMCDMVPEYAEQKDHDLAQKLGFRVDPKYRATPAFTSKEG